MPRAGASESDRWTERKREREINIYQRARECEFVDVDFVV